MCYEVEGGLDFLFKFFMLFGVVIKCGKWFRGKKDVCDINEFFCLFNVRKGEYFIIICF